MNKRARVKRPVGCARVTPTQTLGIGMICKLPKGGRQTLPRRLPGGPRRWLLLAFDKRGMNIKRRRETVREERHRFFYHGIS